MDRVSASVSSTSVVVQLTRRTRAADWASRARARARSANDKMKRRMLLVVGLNRWAESLGSKVGSIVIGKDTGTSDRSPPINTTWSH